MGYYGGCAFLFLSQIGSIFFLATLLINNYIIGEWSRSDDQQGTFKYYACMTYAMVVAQCLGIAIRDTVNLMYSWHATRRLHRRMIDRVFHAPVNLYFDTTPIGRILNRFSKDLGSLEVGFSEAIGSFLGLLYTLFYVIAVAVRAVPWVGVIFPFIFMISYLLVRRTVRPIKELNRVQSVTNSPFLSHLGESISGASTIRAFKKVDDFIAKNNKCQNNNLTACYMMCSIGGWFGIRVGMLSFMLMVILYTICIFSREWANKVILAMLITSVLDI